MITLGQYKATGRQCGVRARAGGRPAWTALAVLGVLWCGAGLATVLPPTIDLNTPPGTESAPVLRVYGDDSPGGLGSDFPGGVAFGDINGDGFDDVVVGAILADVPGGADAGEVYVIYGSAALPASEIDLHTGGTVSAAGETRIQGDDGGDIMGRAVAVGDVNGDGFDDIILGSDQSGANTPGPGRVTVVYGSASLPGTVVNLNEPMDPARDFRITGGSPGDAAGHAVACGDVDGDGYDDVIIGAFLADAPGGASAGVVYVVYGGATLGNTPLNLQDSPGTYGETRIYGDDANDSAGWSVGAGDWNGDGRDDVIIGAKDAQPEGRVGAGEIYVIYGSPALRGTEVDLDAAPGTHGETRIYGDDATVPPNTGDNTGWALACGDVNADGLDDIIAGAYGADPEGRRGAGKVYILYGSNAYAGQILNLATENDAVTAANETRILGRAMDDQMGWSVASGDLNGDGYDDAIVGVRQGDPSGGNSAGQMIVVYGGPSLVGSVVNLAETLPDVSLGGDDPLDLLGSSVGGGGDADRNGFADAAATAYYGTNPFFPMVDNTTGILAAIFGAGEAESATAAESFVEGDTGWRGLGGRLSPVVRAKLAFTGGTSAKVTATLHRDVSALSNLAGIGTPAQVYWEMDTPRTGWTSAELVLQYLDAEVAGLDETVLALYQAAAPSGPWTRVAAQSLDLDKNEVSATVTALGYFALVEDPVEFGLAISAPSASVTTAGPVTYTVTYTGAAAVTLSEADVTLNSTGSATGTVSVSGSGTATRTVTISNISGEGTLGISLAPGTATDAGANPAPAAGPSAVFEVDNTPPQVFIGPPSVLRTQAGPVSFVVTFADATTVMLSPADVILNKTGNANASVAVTGSGNTARTVTLSNITGEGTLGISLAAGTATDEVGHTAAGAGPSATVAVDNTPPTVSIGEPSVEVTQTGPVTYTITFAGANDVLLTAADITLTATGTANATVEVSGFGNFSRTVTLSNITGEGTLQISVAAGVALDLAGNESAAAGPSDPVTVDNTPPGIAIAGPSVPITTTGPVTYTVTYTGADSITLAADDVSLIATGTATGSVAVSGTGNTRTVTLSGIGGEGTLAIAIAAGTATDAVGNAAPGAGPSSAVTVTQARVGDINGDGRVDAADVQLVVNDVLGIPIGEFSGDVNGDNVVNAADVQLVVNALLGLL